MSAIRTMLGENEELVFETRQHWFIPFMHIVTDALLIVLLIAVVQVVPPAFPRIPRELLYFATAVLGIAVVLSAISELIRWRRLHALVTDRRVIQTHGVLTRSVVDVALDQITGTTLHQSWIGRLVGFGDVILVTTSVEGTIRLSSIDRPAGLRQAIEDARARYDQYLDQTAARVYEDPRDVRALLEQLATLRDRGVLSPAEFEAKKRDLLSRI